MLCNVLERGHAQLSPGRDPRDEMPKPILRTDVMELKDLKPGMILKGTVRNVIDFGAFVDIGVHQDGLVHISEMTDRFIKHPLEAVSVGDIVEVRVLGVDAAKQRISLSMKLEESGDKVKAGEAGQGKRQGDRKGQARLAGKSILKNQAGKNPSGEKQSHEGKGQSQGGRKPSGAKASGGVRIPNSGIFAGKTF